MKTRCPICRKIVEKEDPDETDKSKYFPFCSSRCRFIDLGAWLDSEYKVVEGVEEDQEKNEGDGDVLK